MAEYSRIATGSFTSTGAAKSIYLPFAPTSVKMWNYTSMATPTQDEVPMAYWNSGMGQGFAVIQAFNATPVLTTDNMIAGGISTFSAGLSLQFGAAQQISGITKASPAVVTTASAHGYSTGDVVVFQGLYQSTTTGMPQICGMPFTITVTNTTTFTVIWNTNQSGYTALSASPSGAVVKKVLYPFLYQPGTSVISAITLGTTTTVTTTAAHNLVVGQQVAFHIPSAWGTDELNQNNNTVIPSSPVTGYVTSVTSSTIVVININSASYTAYTSNQTVAATEAGLSFPQMIAVGDVNTGGVAVSAGSVLYPSPVINGISTINGPAIQGAFVNNTHAGFTIGAGSGVTLTSTVLVGATSDVIYWEAMIPDYS